MNTVKIEDILKADNYNIVDNKNKSDCLENVLNLLESSEKYKN